VTGNDAPARRIRVLRPYGLVFVLLLVGLAAGGTLLRMHSADPAERHGEAGPYLATVKAKLLAEPWPEDSQQIANLGAALATVSGSDDFELLHSIHANARMHALLGDPAPPQRSVGDSLQLFRQGSADRKRQQYDPERELLWDRVLNKALTLEAGTAERDWPGWMRADRRPDEFHYNPVGAWVANKRTNGYQSILFPVRITNRGAVTLAPIDGTASFFFEELQRPEMQRPGAAISCPIDIPELAPGASRLAPCDFFYPSWEKNAVDRGLQLVELARSGRLKTHFEARKAPGDPLWKLPRANRPALEAELREYHRLQERDRLRVARERAIDDLILQCVIAIGLVVAGYMAAGLFDAFDLRPHLPQTMGGIAVALVAVVAAAGIWGGSGYGPLVFGIIGLYGVAGLAVGFLLGRWLAPLHWQSRAA
jgi:hypothetical protein